MTKGKSGLWQVNKNLWRKMGLDVRTKAKVKTCCLKCGHGFTQDPIFEVPCPHCKANIGCYCKRPSGHSGPLVDFHGERDVAALKAGFYDHADKNGKPCGKQSTDWLIVAKKKKMKLSNFTG